MLKNAQELHRSNLNSIEVLLFFLFSLLIDHGRRHLRRKKTFVMTEDDPQELWEETQNRYPMLKRDREEVLDTQEQKHRRYWILGTLDTESPMMHALRIWLVETEYPPLRAETK